MRRSRHSLPVLLALLLVGTLVVPAAAQDPPDPQPDEPGVLVFHKTTGFRHPSTEKAVATVQELGAANGFDVDQTQVRSPRRTWRSTTPWCG